jgi:Zn-dependent M28 family amino/carboxypeptidase
VIISAHLDSVPDGPGILDDGFGVAVLLDIAHTSVPRHHPEYREIRVPFGSEEEAH